jgi:hypothetical protein
MCDATAHHSGTGGRSRFGAGVIGGDDPGPSARPPRDAPQWVGVCAPYIRSTEPLKAATAASGKCDRSLTVWAKNPTWSLLDRATFDHCGGELVESVATLVSGRLEPRQGSSRVDVEQFHQHAFGLPDGDDGGCHVFVAHVCRLPQFVGP